MNYRHAFHAGNFADLVKHAALLEALVLLGRAGPLTVVDTHAGAGVYDLTGEAALKSGEARAGVGRLMDEAEHPAPLAALARAVREVNDAGALRRYPGSASLIADRLRPGDRLFAFELRAEEHAALTQRLGRRAGVVTRCADGFAEAAAVLPAKGAALVLIDPPFERADDYRRTTQTARAILARNREAVVMVWTPLKDLETFDGFLRDLAEACPGAPLLAAETRLRPLADPMRMNGCALVFVRAPALLIPALEAICGWTAARLGETGASARIWSPA